MYLPHIALNGAQKLTWVVCSLFLTLPEQHIGATTIEEK
jgi:hypothetical protein